MATKLTVTAGVIVHAEQQRVWDLVVDWSRQREWILGTRTAGGHGTGAAVVERTGVGPVGFTDEMEITEWEPPTRCVVRHIGAFVRGYVRVVAIAPAGNGRLRVTA